VPELRFNEFTNDYTKYRLAELMVRVSEHNKDEEFNIDDILSLSSIYGIVDRKELLEDTYSKVNHLNYIKTRLNEFVYGKSISASYPYGLFKANRCRDGLLSTLYFTFKTFENANSAYLDKYFSYHNRANNFLKKYVLVGDRYITADANYILSGKISTPDVPEQTKVVELFDKIEDKIILLEQKLENLKLFKKGLFMKLYPLKENLPKLRFNEFKDRYSGAQFKYITMKTGKKNKSKITYPMYSINNKVGFLPQEEQFDRNNKVNIKDYRIVEPDDFAYNPARVNVGSIGFNDIGETVIVSSLYVVFNTATEIDNKYLFQYFKSKDFTKGVKRYEEGSVRLYLFYDNFASMRFKYPSIQEQKKVASMLSIIDKKISVLNKKLEALKQFTSTLSTMFTYTIITTIIEVNI
jgi:type I restriction enzyme, S subunit